MRRRQPPNVLLYGLGLALLLSLGFNSYLLLDQRNHAVQAAYTAPNLRSVATADSLELDQQLRACARENLHKDSIIHVLEQVAHTP